MIKKIFLMALLCIVFISGKVYCQKTDYSLYASYYSSPSVLSYKMIYRTDYFNEPYNDASVRGFGFGYSIKLFKIFSPEFNVVFYNMRGIDKHVDEEVKFKGVQLRIGGIIHSQTKNPEVDLNVGFISNLSRVTDYNEFRDKGDGGGGYLGPSIVFNINDSNAIRVASKAMIFGSNFRGKGSSDIRYIISLNTEFSLSYVFKF